MSSVVSALTGGSSEAGYRAAAAPIANPATVEQANQQYGNMQQGLDQQQAFLQAIQAQNGLQNQSNVYNQLQNVAAGQGPNPAQTQLANSTGANVANQAAMMAGQRGSSANVGMMARQAAQQGANIQQQAAGQGAALQAQQSLAAMGQAGQMANQQAGQQQQATNAFMQGSQGAYGATTGNINTQNQANVGMQSNRNSANAGVQGEVAKGQMDLLGNVASSIGSAMMLAEGGVLPTSNTTGPMSHFAKMMADGGKVPAMVSPGEKYLTPQQAAQVSSGKADPMTVGKTIPGKPKVGGAVNDYANDTVPASLESGGIVIPRSVTQAKDAEARAQAFVKAHFQQQANKKRK